MNGMKLAGESFEKIQQSIHDITSQIQGVSAIVEQMAADTDQFVKSIDVIAEVATTSASGTKMYRRLRRNY